MAGSWKYMEGWRRKKGGRKITGERAIPADEQSSWELI